jgi:hypothetical protein
LHDPSSAVDVWTTAPDEVDPSPQSTVAEYSDAFAHASRSVPSVNEATVPLRDVPAVPLIAAVVPANARAEDACAPQRTAAALRQSVARRVAVFQSFTASA